MKRCSTSLITKKMQIKTTMSHPRRQKIIHSEPSTTKMAAIKYTHIYTYTPNKNDKWS